VFLEPLAICLEQVGFYFYISLTYKKKIKKINTSISLEQSPSLDVKSSTKHQHLVGRLSISFVFSSAARTVELNHITVIA
jgi:hypothetical protein